MMMNAFSRVFLTVIALYYYIRGTSVLMTDRIASELASFFPMVSGVGGMYVL